MSNSGMALAVIVRGEIVESNFKLFAEKVETQLAEINTDLKTDEDFGQAELDLKKIKEIRSSLTDRKREILEQLEGVYGLVNGLESLDSGMLKVQSLLTKEVKSKKAEIKKDIVDCALSLIVSDNREKYRDEITATMRGKSNLASIKDGVQNAAEEINKRHAKNYEIINAATDEHGAGIAPDFLSLIDMAEYALMDQIARRVELKIQRKETERLESERIAAEKELADMKRKESEALDQKNKSIPDRVKGKFKDPEPIKGSTLPAPPKIDSIPTRKPAAQEEETAWEEMSEFLTIIESAFAPVKSARLNLKHQTNIDASNDFAKSLGECWMAFKKQTS